MRFLERVSKDHCPRETELRTVVELQRGGSSNVLRLKHPFDNFLLAQSGSGASGVWFCGKGPAGVFECHLRACNRGAIIHNSHTESLFP